VVAERCDEHGAGVAPVGDAGGGDRVAERDLQGGHEVGDGADPVS
jgi:hypothetical protein